jgi:hypothetical protein
MTFARTWIKVPFMRFDRSIVDKAGTATTASTRTLAPGVERAAWYGSPMFKETSTLENPSGGAATPNESSADVDPPRSQLPPSASIGSDGPESALPLMPSVSPPTLAPTARQPARTVPHTPHCMAATVEGLGTHCWSKPCFSSVSRRPLAERVMSESFVHKSTIAGCGYSPSHLPSGPHARGTPCRTKIVESPLRCPRAPRLFVPYGYSSRSL